MTSLLLTSRHLSSRHLTSHHLSSPPHIMSPLLTSPHITSPLLSSSHHDTSPHVTSHHITSPLLLPLHHPSPLVAPSCLSCPSWAASTVAASVRCLLLTPPPSTSWTYPRLTGRSPPFLSCATLWRSLRGRTDRRRRSVWSR